MSIDTGAETDQPAGARRPRVLPWVIGVVAAIAVAVVGFAYLDSHEEPESPASAAGGQGTVTKLTMSAAQGRCMAPDPTTLAQAELAFAGSVVSVADGLVTLEPSTWYAGDHTDSVTVQQADPGMADLVGAVDFRPGQDYFVAANDGKVMVCGFSGENSSDLASLYQQAFSGTQS